MKNEYMGTESSMHGKIKVRNLVTLVPRPKVTKLLQSHKHRISELYLKEVGVTVWDGFVRKAKSGRLL